MEKFLQKVKHLRLLTVLCLVLMLSSFNKVVAQTNCEGTPNPGNTISSVSSVCPTQNFTLSLENATAGAGVTYQWESADDVDFTVNPENLGTNSTQTANISSSKYFRCLVTCTNSSESAYSTPVLVTATSFLECYCIPPVPSYGCDGDNVVSVVLGTLNDVGQTCTPVYQDRSALQNAIPTLTQGQNIEMSVGVGDGGTEYVGVWIDFDQNGVFDADEFFALGSGNDEVITNTITIPIDALAGNTKMRVRSKYGSAFDGTDACGGVNYGSTRDYLVNLTDPPTCFSPISIEVSDITLTSATITWTASISAPTNGYQIYYNTTGEAPNSSATPIDVSAGTTSFPTGDVLTHSTTYYFWLRSNCGGDDFSVWAGPVEVTTPMVVTPPWSEGFASSATPAGWTTSSMSLNNSNSAIINGGASGYFMYKNLYSSATTGNFSTVLVGPISGTEDFSFDYKIANYYSPYAPPASGTGNFVLEISTDLGNTWTQMDSVDNNAIAGWQNKSYSISTYAGAGDYVKFRVTVQWITSGGDYCMAFDNFNIASCMPVAALSATDLTENTATVSWIASSSNPGNYQVYVSTLNIAPADDETDVQTTDTASIDLTGLNNNPVHYIWVRADCGAGDYSTWTGPLTVWTSCVPLAGLPYEENFDSYGTGSSAFPNCWARPVTYSGYPYIVSAYSASSPASLRFNSSTTDPTYAISPAFAEDIHNLRVSFKLKASSTSSSGTIDVGVMSDPTDINTFETVATITPTNTSFNYYYYDLYSTTLSGANNHIAFRHNATSTSSYYWLDDFKVELSPSCIEPANLATNNLTTNSIDLSWTPLLTPPTNGYDIYLSLNNTAPTVSTTATYNTGNAGYYTINGLDAQTTYYVWLRSICSVGDTSAWAIPVTFTTLCAPESTLPYTQNFDSYSSGEYPDCWLRPVINSGFPSIVSGSSYYVSSPNGLKFQSLTTTPTYAISPAFSEDIQNLRVKFQLRAESTTSSGTIELGVMSDPYDLSTFESVAIIQPENTSFNAYQYDLYSTTLSGENRHIAFKHNSNANNYYFWLDNFEVDLSPTCIEPNGFAVNSVTANSATISWTASTSNPASYQVYCSINNTAPAEDETNVETTPENTIDLSGLSETTQYYVWVRSDCGASDFSAWGEPLEFTTLCYPADVPFFEGFENGYNHDDVVEGCWTQESLAGAEFWTANQTYVDYNRTPRTGSFNAFLGYNNTDWLFYRVNLIQGQAYDFTVWARQDATSGALLTLAWGAENNAAAMTNIIVNEQAIINGDYQEVRGTFTVPTDGVYYIGIKGTLNYTPWYLSIDDISLDFGPTCVEPTAIVASEITANSANISWTASVSAPASYHVYYSTTNTAPADDIADAEYAEVTGLTTELSELTPVTTYYVWVRSACGADENSVWTGISFETTPSCFEPTNIQASDITINSANISWTAATESPDATYHVYYSLVDAAPADDIDIAECEAPATNSIELTDLTSSSTYYVWVRSVCGADDFSTWAGPSVFSTSCAIISEYPYFEGFNSGIDPACWTIIDNDNSGDSWYSGTYASTPSYEGASMMVSEFSYPNDDWLISPQFKITSDNLKVDFYAKSYSAYFYESFNVLISKTGTSPSDFTIVLENIVDHPNTWQNHEYILSEHGINIDDEIYVAIQHVSNDQFVLFIDAFTVSEIEIPSAEAEILTYSIPNQVGEAEINSGATEGTITVTMPYDTEVANLVANFTLSYGATAKVDTEDQASGVTPNNFTDPVVYVVTAEDGTTTKNWTVTVNLEDAPSSEANILTYSFAEQYSPAVIDDVNHTVTVVVNEGTSLDALVATFTLSPGASAKIGAVDQESGVTENNFTDPVIYTVTAEDGTTTKDWTVTVNVSTTASSEAEILTYSLPNQVGEAEINSGATEGTITVTMPYDTEVANLVANFTLSYGATAKVDTEDQASGVTPNNFTDPVVYAVTAQDGSTIKNWTVTVNLEDAPSSEANILTYSFAEQYSPAVIDDVNHTVTVVVNEGTSLDALVATFTLSDGATAKIGAVDQESGVTENNFTDPVIYTVTAEDGTTTQPWTVTVSVYVGIEDVENSALAIYPNPNNGNFTLDFTNINGKVNYQIYDTKGSIIISDDFVANGSAIKEVSLNLVPGVYFVRLVTETQSLVEKLVVE